jgi:signal recognition particle receptor subunit beta
MMSKVVVVGAPGSGVTTFLQSLGGTYHPADPTTSLSIHPESAELSIGDDQFWLPVSPPNLRDTSLFEILNEGALGYILIVDTTQPESFSQITELLAFLSTITADTPIVIAANKQDLPGASPPEMLADEFGVDEISVVPCVATDYESVQLVLFRVLGKGTGPASIEKGIAHWERALAAHREAGNRGAMARALTNLGNTCRSLRRYKDAIGYFEQALSIHREMGDRPRESGTLRLIGAALHNLGKFAEAATFYEQSLVIDRETGSPHSEALTLLKLGLTLEQQGEITEAIACIEQARSYYSEVGLPRIEDCDKALARLRAR